MYIEFERIGKNIEMKFNEESNAHMVLGWITTGGIILTVVSLGSILWYFYV